MCVLCPSDLSHPSLVSRFAAVPMATAAFCCIRVRVLALSERAAAAAFDPLMAICSRPSLVSFAARAKPPRRPRSVIISEKILERCCFVMFGVSRSILSSFTARCYTLPVKVTLASFAAYQLENSRLPIYGERLVQTMFWQCLGSAYVMPRSAI